MSSFLDGLDLLGMVNLAFIIAGFVLCAYCAVDAAAHRRSFPKPPRSKKS